MTGAVIRRVSDYTNHELDWKLDVPVGSYLLEAQTPDRTYHTRITVLK
jgi:hypothetical protein